MPIRLEFHHSCAAVVVALGCAATPLAALQAEPQSAAAAADTLETRAIPEDTYADAGVRDLITRARRARQARAKGLASFELTFRERLYAGLAGRAVRRERAMYTQERAARVYWGADGKRVVKWLGVRRGVPMAGIGVEFDDDPHGDDAFDLDFDVLDPHEDRVFLGSGWALHPLADTASYHYRYRAGDTLRIRFPGASRTVTLVEVLVEPREGRFDRIVGSLWFDNDDALLARAAYRPAIDYDLDREEPEDAADVPGFMKPIRARVDYITVDYGLQELRWWLPNRMAFEGTATVGGLASIPIRLEWTFEDYAIDAPQTLDPREDEVPEGWSRWVEEDQERATRTIVIVPPPERLLTAPELPEPWFSGSADALTDEDVAQVTSRLSELDAPASPLPGPSFLWGLSPGLTRYNRVEGFSPGARLTWPTGTSTQLEISGRIGLSEWEPGAQVRWFRESPVGSLGVGGFRRLTGLGDWGNPLGFGNSINSLLTGYDDGLYFRETGLEVFGSKTGARARWDGRLFAERQQPAHKTTNASFPAAVGDRVFPDNVRADRGEIAGASGRVRVFSGVNPAAPVLSATVWGEAAAGDFDYGRIAASTALSAPLFGAWTGAIEVGSGTTFGNPSAQRLYYMGGPYTLRAFDPGSAGGEAFWLGRAEFGVGFRAGPSQYDSGGSAFRVTAFSDAAWAGPRSDFGTRGWQASVGAGLSIFDGLLRFDLARAVRGGDVWRLHIYADGLM